MLKKTVLAALTHLRENAHLTYTSCIQCNLERPRITAHYFRSKTGPETITKMVSERLYVVKHTCTVIKIPNQSLNHGIEYVEILDPERLCFLFTYFSSRCGPGKTDTFSPSWYLMLYTT